MMTRTRITRTRKQTRKQETIMSSGDESGLLDASGSARPTDSELSYKDIFMSGQTGLSQTLSLSTKNNT